MSTGIKKQISPLKREASISSINYSSMAVGESQLKNRQQIEHLVSKFNEVNEQVEINLNEPHFNLINYQRQNEKIKYDPQMMAAKLRKLENRAQINRAQREIQNRQKKKMKKFTSKPHQTVGNYKTIYKNFLMNNKLSEQFEDLSEDESAESRTTPKGVAYFSQLKRHPLLLQYTIQKIHEKQREGEQRIKNLQNTLTKFKKQNIEISSQYKDILDEFNKKLIKLGQNNPEKIIQSRFSKFYTKKSSDKLSKEVQSIPRCSKMISKQNQIMSQIDERSLSKQNKQKLKSRLNEIINSISRSQKLNSNQTHPKLPQLHQTLRQTDKKQ